MKKRFYTFCVNNDYPKWMPSYLANNLYIYGWDLVCFINKHESLYKKADNLYFMNANLLIPNDIFFEIKDSWYKMLLFNSDVFPSDTLFIDINSLVLNDPQEIANFVKNTMEDVKQGKYLVMNSDTNLMYINHHSEYTHFLWRKYRLYNNQGFPNASVYIKEMIRHFFGVLVDALYMDFPKAYMGSYKEICKMDDPSSVIQNHTIINFDDTTIFNVVKDKQQLYESFEPYVK